MFKQLKNKLYGFMSDEHGASAIEYGLIAALIAAVIIVAVTGIGGGINSTFVTLCTKLGGTACS